MASKETYYDEISVFDTPESSVPKQPQEGKVMVDSRAIYIGDHSNWRYPWKNISDIVFDGRERLIITCNDGKSIECMENGDDRFSSFREHVLKLWNKKQGKKAAKAAEQERNSRPPAKKQKTYGKTGRSYAKPRMMSMTMAQNRTDFSSDEEDATFETTKTTLKQEIKDEVPADEEEEEENEFNDGESPPGFEYSDEEDFDDHQTPAVKPNRVSGITKRGGIQRILDEDDDSDDDAATLTTPASKRLVSPANALDDENEQDVENQEPSNKQPDSMAKGTQPITNFFSHFTAGNKASATSAKAPAAAAIRPTIAPKSPKRKPSPFAKSPLPAKSPIKTPLKQDNTEWLSKRPSTSPLIQSGFFPKAKPSVLEEDGIEEDDNESVSSAPPMSSEVKAGLYGTGDGSERDKENHAKEVSIVDTPPRESHLHPTSGVDRNRFRLKRTPAAKRSRADDALDALSARPSTPKRNRPNRYGPYIPLHRRNPNFSVLKPNSPWRGLRNLGNTCYINSSLQMLFTVPAFVSSLAGKGKDLSKSLVSVSNDVKDTSAIRSANPSILKKAIDAVTDKFEGYQQRDAHEFLSDLVDRVHDELEEEQKEMETTETTPPFPTDEYFRMNVQVCLTCDSCGYARNKEEMYRHLSIDVEDENAPTSGTQDKNRIPPWSVQEGIDQFFAPEKREIKCEKCSDGTTATQTLQILSRPKALLLHLKRFVLVEKPKIEVTNVDATDDAEANTNEPKRKPAVEMTIRKNKAPVVLDSTVSLGPIVSVEADKENSRESHGPMAAYDVKSVAHHIGGTAWSGHYTCDAVRESDSKISSQQWVSFDDGATSATTADQVLKSEKSQKTAYMLLYTIQE